MYVDPATIRPSTGTPADAPGDTPADAPAGDTGPAEPPRDAQVAAPPQPASDYLDGESPLPAGDGKPAAPLAVAASVAASVALAEAAAVPRVTSMLAAGPGPAGVQATWHGEALLLWRADAPMNGNAPLPGEVRRVDQGELPGLFEHESAGAADSFRCWGRLAAFVRAALEREQFYPAAHREAGRVVARWRLLLTDDRDVERLEAFAAAMPGACFALDGPKADRLEAVEAFLNAVCDTLVRRSLAKDEFFATVHEKAAEPFADAEVRWVSALLADDAAGRQVTGNREEVAALLDKVQAWTARLGDAGGEPWRLGFILDEPPPAAGATAAQPDGTGEAGEAGEVWNLRFRLLPPPDLADQHAPLTAAQVWHQPAGSIGFVGRNAVRLRERLAAELVRAADFCPPLRRILAAGQVGREGPEAVSLGNAEAFRFIREWGESLQDGGFDVQLPQWANSGDHRVEVVMNLTPLDDLDGPPGGAAGGDGRFDYGGGGGSVGLDSLLKFDWKVAVGGESMTAEEFRELVAQQSPLVRRGGKWIEVDPEAAAAAAELMATRPPGTLTLGDAFRMGFGLGKFAPRTGAAPAVRLAGVRWVEQLLEQTPDAKANEVPQPATFGGQEGASLRPYQLRGLQWLAFLDRLGLGGCLADDMGLGKTIQFISLLLHDRERRDAHAQRTGVVLPTAPTLLFVPTSVLGNWNRELARFAPSLKVLLHHGPQRLRGEAFRAAAEACDVVVTSYALSHRDVGDLKEVTWGRLALDEAQKIKNPTAASSVAVRSIGSPKRVALTGTPVENHLGELWSIMDLLNPGLLGTHAEFRDKFATPIEKQNDRGKARRLREMIRPFVLRRTKDDPDIVGDLPEKMEMNVYCGLTPEQAAIYERITGEMLGRIDTATGIRRRGLILSVLTKLKQVCDHPALLNDQTPRVLNRSGKAERLAEMLEEVIDEGERALVFTQYRQMGTMLEEMLSRRLNRPILFLHGGTPQGKRDDMVAEFQRQAHDSPPVFILSLRAGGLGLNLTAASHVFHFDRWWNPAVENQATDRAHRIGQVRRVQVHKFVSIGTVEERIDRMLAEKSQLAQNIVGSGDEWLTDLSTSELREYLALSREAVSGDEEAFATEEVAAAATGGDDE